MSFLDERAPVFVKVDEGVEIQELLDKIQQKLGRAHELLARINGLKQKEDEQLSAWQKDLEDVKSRLSSVDTALAEPEL